VKRVTDIIAEISAASQEQAIGIDQVNKAIASMDQTTQQNVGLVEATTSEAQSMKEQAKELLRQVDVFKITQDNGSQGGRAPMVREPLWSTGKPIFKPLVHAGGSKTISKTSAPQKPAEHNEPVSVTTRHKQDHVSIEGEFEEF
jgi:methyl-accepting chemotaxis protein